jgi:mannosyltransferase
MRVAWLGRHVQSGIARMTLGDLMRLRGRVRPVIWHARRNNEMIVGVLLKRLGWPLRLVFTSAAQRHHTWITRWLITRMDAVIATSRASAGYLKRPATVILHGVDPGRYAPPSDRHAAFAASGLPGKYAIGCFGRVRPQKGTDVFVEAMCRLLPRHPDASAVVIGAVSPDQRGFAAGLAERVRLAGLGERLRLLGELPIEEVPEWYRRISIYAFTSRQEGFGLTLLEAMASGCALVAARAGGAADVVRDGETGLLVPPGDVDALERALESMMRDLSLAAAMGARARSRISAEFTVDAESARIVSVYREVLARTALRPLAGTN